jgi:hypothetical protein
MNCMRPKTGAFGPTLFRPVDESKMQGIFD